MRQLFFFTFILFNFTTSACSFIKKKQRILFIGNSMTYYNAMPATLQKMAEQTKLDVEIEELTMPGARLYMFATMMGMANQNESFRQKKDELYLKIEKILSKKWNAVVLQEASGMITVPCFYQNTYQPSVSFLDSITRSMGGKTILFQNFTASTFPYSQCENRCAELNYSKNTGNPFFPCLIVQEHFKTVLNYITR